MSRNILILNYEYPPLGGGAGVVSQKYAEGLSGLGHKVTVVTTWLEGEQELKTEGNLTIIRLKSLRKKAFQSNPLEMLSWAWKARNFLSEYCKSNSFDDCIAFFGIPGGIVARHLKQKFGIPYIISTHGADIPGFYPKKMRKYHLVVSWYIRKVWKDARKILFLTTDMRKLGMDFNPSLQDKYEILPNGCDTSFFYPDDSKKQTQFTVLFVGRLCDEKDPFTLLKAIKEMRKESGDFSLRIIGDGPLRGEMEAYVTDNDLGDVVNFIGWKTKEELREEYQSAHVQVCASRVEAMSVGVLESMLSGLYVLSTPVSGNKDMITNGINGVFFEIGDYQKLSEKIIHLNDSFHELKVNQEITERLKQEFQWSYIISKLNKIILGEF